MAAAAAKGTKKDPLVLLREFTSQNKKIVWSDEKLVFDEVQIPKNTRCGFRLGGPKAPACDIGSIWFMYNETSRDRPYSQDTAKKKGFKYIGVATRGDLCDYILGRVDTCDGLIKDVIEGRKRPREEADEPNKVRKTQQPGEAPVGVGPLVDPDAVKNELCHQDVSSRMRPVQDLDVLVRCPGRQVPNADLILKIAQDEFDNWHKVSHGRRKDQVATGKTPFVIELEENLRKNPENKPIILVPCNKNAPVNLLNVQELLQFGTYSKPDEEKVRFFESTRPEYVEVKRNIGGKVWCFEVRDSAKGFSRSQWYRVVAIITDGSDWQFKGWPFADIVDMFATIRGVFFQPSGVLVPLHVEKWSVAVLQLSPLQLGHRFAQIRDKFFVEVETFLNSYRMRKFVNHTTLEGGRKILQKPLNIL